MNRAYAPQTAVVGMLAALAIAALPASAQTTSTPSSKSMSIKVPRTTATPEMIEEAIERSKARTERFKATGEPEQFGSEEPFRFNRTK
jgi:hypothetical protein